MKMEIIDEIIGVIKKTTTEFECFGISAHFNEYDKGTKRLTVTFLFRNPEDSEKKK